jgi:double-stranded uracil-DNA glycosylase
MPRARSFAPILGMRPTVLILGSLPGVASLAANQYYAHPRNQFWEIMAVLFGTSAQLPYNRRVAMLKRNGIALWDVLAEAARPGSLDSRIHHASAQTNDLVSLMTRHTGIRLVAFNGATAARVFDRAIRPQLSASKLPAFVTLPSTSPAHAAMPFQLKLERWSILKTAATASRDA